MATKTKKAQVKVGDLKPSKDAKGGKSKGKSSKGRGLAQTRAN